MQLIFLDRLRQVIVHPGAEQLLFLPGHGVCGDRNDWCLLLMRKLVDQFAGTNAVHVWHLNIHQDQVKRHLSGAIHRLMPAVTEHDVLDLVFQQCANQLEVRRVVVYRHDGHCDFALV